MGYYSTLEDACFQISVENYNRLTETGIDLEKLEEEHSVSFSREKVSTKICECCGNPIKVQFKITGLTGGEDKYYHFQEKFLMLLAPYVELPCWVEFVDTCGDRWRDVVVMDQNTGRRAVKRIQPKISWD